MTSYPLDPRSVAGKSLTLAGHTQLLVVGAGPAGLAAAMEAMRLGLSVVLVDENPVPAEIMGLDVPLHFGGRMGGAVRNRNAMLEAVLASDPALAEAFEAGVDLRLGTAVWGLYGPNASVGWLPGKVAGLAEDGRSWLLGCDRVIVAAGRRDIGLAFPGWELPGVLGIGAARVLAQKYRALEVRRAVVLGSTPETFADCIALRAAGIEIVAVVEVAAAALHTDWAPGAVLTGHVIRQAEGNADGLSAVILGAVDAKGRPLPGTERCIACDAVLLGIGAVPAIELLDALGCRQAFQPERGGFAPVLDAAQQTSIPGVYAAGDCAGIWPEKTASRALAEAEGRCAAGAAAASLGVTVPPARAVSIPATPGFDLSVYRLGWVRASVVEAAGTPHVCQCEEVTARDILELRPPRYLNWPENRRNDRALRDLLGNGPPNPDQVKRLTRAGMGLCQGRRCREQVAALLALGTGTTLGEVPLATHRAPVRPLSLATLAETVEDPGMTAQWDTWFGMPAQYQPPWEVAPLYTAAGRDPDAEVASE